MDTLIKFSQNILEKWAHSKAQTTYGQKTVFLFQKFWNQVSTRTSNKDTLGKILGKAEKKNIVGNSHKKRLLIVAGGHQTNIERHNNLTWGVNQIRTIPITLQLDFKFHGRSQIELFFCILSPLPALYGIGKADSEVPSCCCKPIVVQT